MSGNWQQNNWDNKQPWERNWYDPANPAFQQQQQQQAEEQRRRTEQAAAETARAIAAANAAQAAQREAAARANADLLRRSSDAGRPAEPRPVRTTSSTGAAGHQHTPAPRRRTGGKVLGVIVLLGGGVYGITQGAAYYDANFSSLARQMKGDAERCVTRNDESIRSSVARGLMAGRDPKIEHVKGVQWCVNIVRSHYGGHAMPVINP